MIGCVDSAGYTSYTEPTEPRHKQALFNGQEQQLKKALCLEFMLSL